MDVPPPSPAFRLAGPPLATYMAMHVLDAVEDGHEAAYVLSRASKRAHASEPVASQAYDLVMGVLRGRNRLDAHLEAAGLPKQPWHRQGLRIAALAGERRADLEPARAAMNALQRLKRRAWDVENVDEVARAAAAATFGDDARGLALRHGHPQWLVEEWANSYAAELEALLSANNEDPPLVVRANLLKTQAAALAERLAAEGFVARPRALSPEALAVEPKRGAFRTGAFAEGLFEAQDEGSQLVALLCQPQPGQRILDACAGAGGKTLALGARMANKGKLVALDTSAAKLSDLKKRAGRAGLFNYESFLVDESGNAVASAKDLRRKAVSPREVRLPESFDAVLVDAPCSGLGAIRRTPEIRWRRGPDDLARYPAIQRGILARRAAQVRAGGVLVYATCTLRGAENEAVVEEFLREHADFSVADAAARLPEAARSHGVADANGFLR
ncbi:MAG TPA: RsmB/NOP family class I SAM-dependent RNA methyltransferase, partial [Candidatus Thermoplasmatota archaeon]|nr:RsmB/NOP family class I SAM-dependent RNA methyltransferase [Candidatus Thermoplasmatota archaeon]